MTTPQASARTPPPPPPTPPAGRPRAAARSLAPGGGGGGGPPGATPPPHATARTRAHPLHDRLQWPGSHARPTGLACPPVMRRSALDGLAAAAFAPPSAACPRPRPPP